MCSQEIKNKIVCWQPCFVPHNSFSLQKWAVKFEYPWKGDFCGEWVIRIVGAQTGVLGCRVRGGTTVNLVGTCSGVRGGLKSTLEKSGWDGVKGKVEGAGYLSRARQTLYGASPFFCQIPSSRIATQEWGFNLENLINF